MTSEPKAPGAPAIILFREVDRDDGERGHEEIYFRIKILTDEGRKYGDIEIPFVKGESNVANLHARTIKVDGTIVDFTGGVFEQAIAKARGAKYLAKTFTLPEVQAGCIIEYYFTLELNYSFTFGSHWVLNDDLFTRSAKFSLSPYTNSYYPINLTWVSRGLPPGTAPPAAAKNRVVSLEVSNIPAFHAEDYMPPENEMKSRVDFVYSYAAFEPDPTKFWKKWGQDANAYMEKFIDKHRAMEQAASGIVAAGDSPETKLQKIYSRVQQLRNTSFEAGKTEQERKRDKEKAPTNVEEVWKKQYGSGGELTWLFLALARAAGFEAYGMWVPDRLNYFFNVAGMDSYRLDTNVVVVKLSGKDAFFDPGSKFIPFGMLPWFETSVKGLKLDKDGGSWLETALPDSAQSGIARKAELKLSETGDLEGKVTVTLTGLEASRYRMDENLSDDTERKKFLEDTVKESVPVAAEVELTNQPDWKSSSREMVAEFSVKVPGWASNAGRREILPVGLFSAPEKHVFDHAERTQPIYFSYPFHRVDDISIELPSGWKISTLPRSERQDAHMASYSVQAENDKETLHLHRALNVDILLMESKFYPTLRNFFQGLRAADEQPVVLQPAAASASN